ncbi:MAG TPA: hypothetical protein VFA26_13380 [Gemmataceae bacterium]|nr:hypothetical protein [Gemmataceae bacterium]
MNTRTAEACLPPAPTAAPPGSPEKIRVLAERARMRVALWHPLDARGPSGSAQGDFGRLTDLCAAS